MSILICWFYRPSLYYIKPLCTLHSPAFIHQSSFISLQSSFIILHSSFFIHQFSFFNLHSCSLHWQSSSSSFFICPSNFILPPLNVSIPSPFSQIMCVSFPQGPKQPFSFQYSSKCFSRREVECWQDNACHENAHYQKDMVNHSALFL